MNVMVVQYCQTYTDREDGKIFTYDLYSLYGSWKRFTHRTDRTNCTNRTVREKDSRMVNTAFQSVKESVCNLVKHGKIRRSARIVQTVRTESGFTDRANRTVLEKDSRIVNTAFQSVKESVCNLVKHGKIRRSARIVRTVRTESGITDRANRMVREKHLRIVNTVFNR